MAKGKMIYLDEDKKIGHMRVAEDLVIELKSDKDNRKVILFSTKKLIYDFEIFYCDHTDEMKKF